MSMRLRLGRRPAGRMRFRLGRPIVEGSLARIWWVVLARAAAAVIFGVATLVWPRHTAYALVWLFGTYALIDGATALLASVSGGGLRIRWWLTLAGATSLAAGLAAFTKPRFMALTLIAVLGLWLIVRGASEVVGAATLRREARARPKPSDHWSLLLNGLMSAVFGVGLIAWPRVGALALVWAVGVWAILHGLLMTPWALHLRSARDGDLAAREAAPSRTGSTLG